MSLDLNLNNSVDDTPYVLCTGPQIDPNLNNDVDDTFSIRSMLWVPAVDK